MFDNAGIKTGKATVSVVRVALVFSLITVAMLIGNANADTQNVSDAVNQIVAKVYSQSGTPKFSIADTKSHSQANAKTNSQADENPWKDVEDFYTSKATRYVPLPPYQ